LQAMQGLRLGDDTAKRLALIADVVAEGDQRSANRKSAEVARPTGR
jgi:hypothetical protein